ncbi:hypothetical protein GCM10010211_81510 [Streptomyces albospinus]|uniref:Uncharacterized protein n=1 Tax=Streptomyces albospinus TaxID=285515 RepID=A0ABQ2VRW9_9ACTN|nr:hypothetical protein GCM10010211_81510 [Streptomyces albospinus]
MTTAVKTAHAGIQCTCTCTGAGGAHWLPHIDTGTPARKGASSLIVDPVCHAAVANVVDRCS